MTRVTMVGAAIGAAFLCALPVSLQWSETGTPSIAVDTADARVGRPLTPVSVAGVNRRVHRRAYRGAVYNSYAAPYPGYGYPY